MNVIKSLSEYINLVKLAVEKRDQIIEAIRTSAKLKKQKKGELKEGEEISDEAVAEIMRRKDLCSNCAYNSDIARDTRNYNSSVPFTHCTLCTCRIGYEDSKEYCLSCNCGMVDWNERNPDKKQMIPKWVAFEEKKSETI